MKNFLILAITLFSMPQIAFCAAAKDEKSDRTLNVCITHTMQNYIHNYHRFGILMYYMKTDLLECYENIWNDFVEKLKDPEFNCEHALTLQSRWGIINKDGEIIEPVKELFRNLDKNKANFNQKCRDIVNNFSQKVEYHLGLFAHFAMDFDIDQGSELFNKLNNNSYNMSQETLKYFAEKQLDLKNKEVLRSLSEIYKTCKLLTLKDKN